MALNSGANLGEFARGRQRAAASGGFRVKPPKMARQMLRDRHYFSYWLLLRLDLPRVMAFANCVHGVADAGALPSEQVRRNWFVNMAHVDRGLPKLRRRALWSVRDRSSRHHGQIHVIASHRKSAKLPYQCCALAVTHRQRSNDGPFACSTSYFWLPWWQFRLLPATARDQPSRNDVAQNISNGSHTCGPPGSRSLHNS